MSDLKPIKAKDLVLGQHAWYDSGKYDGWIIVGVIEDTDLPTAENPLIGVQMCTAWECGTSLKPDELVYPVPGPPTD